jgi:hypothetical protein
VVGDALITKILRIAPLLHSQILPRMPSKLAGYDVALPVILCPRGSGIALSPQIHNSRAHTQSRPKRKRGARSTQWRRRPAPPTPARPPGAMEAAWSTGFPRRFWWRCLACSSSMMPALPLHPAAHSTPPAPPPSPPSPP